MGLVRQKTLTRLNRGTCETEIGLVLCMNLILYMLWSRVHIKYKVGVESDPSSHHSSIPSPQNLTSLPPYLITSPYLHPPQLKTP